jgi:protein gp37
MSGRTAIQWTDMSWNPVTGCTRVLLGSGQNSKQSGCDHCYAFSLHDIRHNAYNRGIPMAAQYAQPFSQIQLLPQRLEDPLRIKTPRKIFVNSMSDLFHSQVPDDYIRKVFGTMKRAHWHTFQILTKRAGRLRRMASQLDWPSNVWVGVSIESDLVVARADALRAVPAELRFISCEPLLGPLRSLHLDGIGWVIVGAESGPDARPYDPDWVRDIRDRCFEHEVAFFHKQMGTVWARENHLKKDAHGGNMENWPLDLRIRQFPAGIEEVAVNG